MSMAHIAGLVSAILSPLTAGGGVVCTPGFAADRFAAWLAEFRPTWTTAVPAIHDAIVDLVDRGGRSTPPHTSLRFIRSVASPIAEPVLEKLEAAFRVPIVQAYGMTEALCLTCTPLVPYRRKPHSVGVSFCPELAVMADDGTLLPPGEAGEVVARGPYVARRLRGQPGSQPAGIHRRLVPDRRPSAASTTRDTSTSPAGSRTSSTGAGRRSPRRRSRPRCSRTRPCARPACSASPTAAWARPSWPPSC